MINDTIDILDPKIINIRVNFVAVVDYSQDKLEALNVAIGEIQEMFSEKLDIGQPIYITKIYHNFEGGAWITNYAMTLAPKPNTDQNKDYKAFSGDLPSNQNVDISDQANINRSFAMNNNQLVENSVDSKTAVSDSSSLAGPAAGNGMLTVTPPAVSKTK